MRNVVEVGPRDNPASTDNALQPSEGLDHLGHEGRLKTDPKSTILTELGHRSSLLKDYVLLKRFVCPVETIRLPTLLLPLKATVHGQRLRTRKIPKYKTQYILSIGGKIQ